MVRTTSPPALRTLPLDNPVDGSRRVCGRHRTLCRHAHHIRPTTRSSSCLRDNGNLLHAEKFVHSYPHCWRHKTPLIFRATPQWFIGLDQERAARRKPRRHQGRALDPGLGRAAHRGHGRQAAGLVHFAPAHLGRADSAVRAHRQRRAAPGHAAADRGRGAAHGTAAASTAWFDLDPARTARAPRPATTTRSPTPWTCGWIPAWCITVLRAAGRRSAFPADLYLEGSDQHRGWFQSSLLTVGGDARPRRPTAACSPTASRSMRRAARCPSRWAMASSRSRCSQLARRRRAAAVGGRDATTAAR